LREPAATLVDLAKQYQWSWSDFHIIPKSKIHSSYKESTEWFFVILLDIYKHMGVFLLREIYANVWYPRNTRILERGNGFKYFVLFKYFTIFTNPDFLIFMRIL